LYPNWQNVSNKLRLLLVCLQIENVAIALLHAALTLWKSANAYFAGNVYINSELCLEAARAAYEYRKRQRERRRIGRHTATATVASIVQRTQPNYAAIMYNGRMASNANICTNASISNYTDVSTAAGTTGSAASSSLPLSARAINPETNSDARQVTPSFL
jgi:hypothetical protein